MDFSELNDIDFDEIVRDHELKANAENELVINLDEEDILDYDVIYSYPYYSDTNYDYQFRLTITNEDYELEEIKVEENEITGDNTKELKTYGKRPLSNFIEIIQNFIDLRDNKTSLDTDFGIVNFDLDPSDSVNLKKNIEINKRIVLKEMYDQIIEIYGSD